MIIKDLQSLGMTEQQLLDALLDDDNYYGKLGKQFLSYSDIRALLNNPSAFKAPVKVSAPLLQGSYFHISILEPHKMKDFKIVDAASRATKKYKDLANGEYLMLKREAAQIDELVTKIMENDKIRLRIKDEDVEYEKPAVAMIEGEYWKGKADIINHDRKMIIDLKTTHNLNMFQHLAYKHNYDGQAYVYTSLFPGYGFGFVAIDKSTGQIGVFKASDAMLQSGKEKVQAAIESYRMWVKQSNFEQKNHYLEKSI